MRVLSGQRSHLDRQPVPSSAYLATFMRAWLRRGRNDKRSPSVLTSEGRFCANLHNPHTDRHVMHMDIQTPYRWTDRQASGKADGHTYIGDRNTSSTVP